MGAPLIRHPWNRSPSKPFSNLGGSQSACSIATSSLAYRIMVLHQFVSSCHTVDFPRADCDYWEGYSTKIPHFESYRCDRLFILIELLNKSSIVEFVDLTGIFLSTDHSVPLLRITVMRETFFNDSNFRLSARPEKSFPFRKKCYITFIIHIHLHSS